VGFRVPLPAGAVVRIMPSLGSGYTVATDRGATCTLSDARDTDALGLSNGRPAQAPTVPRRGFQRSDGLGFRLKTVYDPEIPVNILDLGLVYSCVIGAPWSMAGKKPGFHIKMSHDGSGLRGMGNVLQG